MCCRFLSSPAAPVSEATASEVKKEEASKKEKKDDKNIFFDNLGSIFLAGIGAVIAGLVRSYYGTANKNAVRDSVEDAASIDPIEIDDLRVANSELKLQVFRTILEQLVQDIPQKECTYEEFLTQVRRIMKSLKGDMFTVQLGHLLDRVVLAALQKHGKSSREPMPLAFWLTTLSLALNSSVPERIQVLYEVLENSATTPTTIKEVIEMVGYLQDTCQLVPDSQVVPTSSKYPVQQYKVGTAEELVKWEDETDLMDVDAFADILRSKSVCAWGECYHKKKMV